MQVNLSGVEREFQTVLQIFTDLPYCLRQHFPVFVDKVHVVHVTAVTANMEFALYVVVQRVQVDVPEQLAREVSDGQPAVGRGSAQRLVLWKVVPVLLGTPVYGVPERVVIDKFANEVGGQVLVGNALPMNLVKPLDNQAVQNIPVNAHEEPADVEPEYKGFLFEIVAFGNHVIAGPFYTEECSLSDTAAVAVVYELPVENGVYPVVQQVVAHAVPEVRRDDFPLDGFLVDKAYTWRKLVMPV